MENIVIKKDLKNINPLINLEKIEQYFNSEKVQSLIKKYECEYDNKDRERSWGYRVWDIVSWFNDFANSYRYGIVVWNMFWDNNSVEVFWIESVKIETNIASPYEESDRFVASSLTLEIKIEDLI